MITVFLLIREVAVLMLIMVDLIVQTENADWDCGSDC